MLPEATVHFDGPRDEPYEGKVVVRHSWVFLVHEKEMYPADKVQRIEFEEMDMDGPMEKLRDLFDK